MMNAMLSTNPSAGPSSSASLAQLSPAEIVAVLSQTKDYAQIHLQHKSNAR